MRENAMPRPYVVPLHSILFKSILRENAMPRPYVVPLHSILFKSISLITFFMYNL